MMNSIITVLLLLIGATFLLLASVGIFRMPDLFTRMQTATKASTLGAACMLLAVAVHFNDLAITTRAIAASIFFLLTAPVTAHMIGRASYLLGVPLWSGTVRDELHGRYDLRTHELESSFAVPLPNPINASDPAASAASDAPAQHVKVYDVKDAE